MPKVKPLIRPDPLEMAIRVWIGGGLAFLRINQAELARRAGISKATLSGRIGSGGDIGSMRLSEYLAIKGVFQKGGYYCEPGKEFGGNV